jgi:hypothetical protein
MEPGEALGIAAQIAAVALAGFAGVVFVFHREAVHEWSGIDKLRLRLCSPIPFCRWGFPCLDCCCSPSNLHHQESGDGAAVSC